MCRRSPSNSGSCTRGSRELVVAGFATAAGFEQDLVDVALRSPRRADRGCRAVADGPLPTGSGDRQTGNRAHERCAPSRSKRGRHVEAGGRAHTQATSSTTAYAFTDAIASAAGRTRGDTNTQATSGRLSAKSCRNPIITVCGPTIEPASGAGHCRRIIDGRADKGSADACTSGGDRDRRSTGGSATHALACRSRPCDRSGGNPACDRANAGSGVGAAPRFICAGS
jgi:hypothetical protein